MQVNQTLTNKLLVMEQAFIDEKRRRNEIEGKYREVMSLAQEQDQIPEAEYSVRGNAEDLLKLQSHLASVRQRMENSLRSM